MGSEIYGRLSPVFTLNNLYCIKNQHWPRLLSTIGVVGQKRCHCLLINREMFLVFRAVKGHFHAPAFEPGRMEKPGANRW